MAPRMQGLLHNSKIISLATTRTAEQSSPKVTFVLSLDGLQAMLCAMDIDEQAKPAVESYQRMIAAIPPHRNMAICLGLITRIPALILFLAYMFYWEVETSLMGCTNPMKLGLS
jgi:hypothetical protein